MTDVATTHAEGCWAWGPKHHACAVREIERLRARAAELERDARLGAAVREAVERVEDDHVAGHLVVVSATERSAYDEDDIVITEDKLDVLRAIDRVLAEEEEADDAS